MNGSVTCQQKVVIIHPVAAGLSINGDGYVFVCNQSNSGCHAMRLHTILYQRLCLCPQWNRTVSFSRLFSSVMHLTHSCLVFHLRPVRVRVRVRVRVSLGIGLGLGLLCFTCCRSRSRSICHSLFSLMCFSCRSSCKITLMLVIDKIHP